MSPILGPDGKPVNSNPKQPAKEGQEPVQPKIPLPDSGDLLVGIFADNIEEKNGHRNVSLKFQVHAAITPMEALSVINELALALQPAAQKQMASSIQKAGPDALRQLEKMGIKPPGS